MTEYQQQVWYRLRRGERLVAYSDGIGLGVAKWAAKNGESVNIVTLGKLRKAGLIEWKRVSDTCEQVFAVLPKKKQA